jgi:hypothetical protein
MNEHYSSRYYQYNNISKQININYIMVSITHIFYLLKYNSHKPIVYMMDLYFIFKNRLSLVRQFKQGGSVLLAQNCLLILMDILNFVICCIFLIFLLKMI